VPEFPSNEMISLVGAAPRFDLAESIGPDLRLADLLDRAFESSDVDAHDGLVLDYGTARGAPALRAAIAELHEVEPDDVIVTVGGVHALFLIAFALCERGDEVIFGEPGFPLARNVLTAAGACLRALPLAFDRGYQPDMGLFRDLLSAKTRLVSLASPQNPSGVALAARTLNEVVCSMQERAPQAWLVLDETYRQATYGAQPVAPSAAKSGPRIITVASLSKCHGAPGLRIGWATARDPSLLDRLVTAKFNTVICCSRVDEMLALEVLKRHDRMEERRGHLRDNLAITEQWVRRNESFVEWVRPDAGGLCCVRLKRAMFDDAGVERFYSALARQDVRVAPGNWFGDERRIFRLGFGLPTARDLEEAIRRLSVALERSANRDGTL
jgi:aspartate/methionine/tyrosine aminotransferase